MDPEVEKNVRDMQNMIKANSFSAKNISLTESALAALKNTGASMESFKIRQDFVDSLKRSHGSPWMGADQLLDADDREENHQEYADKIMDMVYESAVDNLLGVAVQQKILPVVMEMDGVRVKVGEAIIDSRDGGFCVMHAVIDGKHNVAELLKTDLGHISIGNKDDFKTEEKTYDDRRHAENTTIEEEIFLKNNKE